MTDIICYFLVENGLVIQKSYPFVEGWVEGLDYVAPGYTYIEGVFTPPIPTFEDILAAATANLLAKQKVANTQVNYLQIRIDTINDAIDMDMATPYEIAEIPVRTAQLKSWKQYRVLLGRMTQQPDWPNDPQWPTEPTIYTTETSAAQPAPAS